MGLIYLDTCIVIYFLEEHPAWGPAIARAFGKAGLGRFAVSPLTEMECLVGPLKRGDAMLRQDFLQFLERAIAVDIPEQVYLDGAAFAARFGWRTPMRCTSAVRSIIAVMGYGPTMGVSGALPAVSRAMC